MSDGEGFKLPVLDIVTLFDEVGSANLTVDGDGLATVDGQGSKDGFGELLDANAKVDELNADSLGVGEIDVDLLGECVAVL